VESRIPDQVCQGVADRERGGDLEAPDLSDREQGRTDPNRLQMSGRPLLLAQRRYRHLWRTLSAWRGSRCLSQFYRDHGCEMRARVASVRQMPSLSCFSFS
jgi:hypothetical protein